MQKSRQRPDELRKPQEGVEHVQQTVRERNAHEEQAGLVRDMDGVREALGQSRLSGGEHKHPAQHRILGLGCDASEDDQGKLDLNPKPRNPRFIIYYSSFHFLFLHPYITPLYVLTGSRPCSALRAKFLVLRPQTQT